MCPRSRPWPGLPRLDARLLWPGRWWGPVKICGVRAREGWDLTTDLHRHSRGEQDEGAWGDPGLQLQRGDLLLVTCFLFIFANCSGSGPAAEALPPILAPCAILHLLIKHASRGVWGGGLLLGGIPLQYGLSGAYFRFSGVVLRWKSHTLGICGLVGRDHFLVGFPHLSGGATAAGCAVRKGWWAFTVRPEFPSGDTGAHSSPCLLTCQGGLRPENCFP